MDTSKEYILMSEKAVKIQEEWKAKKSKDGDYVAYHKEKIIILSNPVLRSSWNCYIFLPRQDQLQEIWLKEFNDKFISEMVDRFNNYIIKTYKSPKTNSDYLKLSMEQLWLAFVMKEKYNKVWDGKDWVVS